MRILLPFFVFLGSFLRKGVVRRGGGFSLVKMRIDVLYFGVLKELFGRERETLELASGARVADALRAVREHASNALSAARGDVWSSLAVAVNREYAGAETELKDSDELALLPPVSGGIDSEVVERGVMDEG